MIRASREQYEELIAREHAALKKAFHEATFMQGQTTPAAKHLFDAIHKAMKETKEALPEAADGLKTLVEENKRYHGALEQIANNNWRDQSRAKFVARQALSQGSGR